jgi:hypothetical protein
MITFTATYTGTYVIDARAYPGSGLTGTYHVDIVQKDAFDESDAFGSATPITVGTEYYGFIDSAATGPTARRSARSTLSRSTPWPARSIRSRLPAAPTMRPTTSRFHPARSIP